MISKKSSIAAATVFVAALFGGAIGFALHSGAYQPSTPSLKAISTAVRSASHGDLTPVRILSVSKSAMLPSNVMPIEVTANSRPALIWAAYNDGKFVFFPGSAFDTKGTNLAISLMGDLQSPQTRTAHPSQASAVNGAVNNTPGFIWAASGQQAVSPNVVLFADPNCIFCHREFTQLKPLVDAGKIVVKVVPVAFLKASSMGKAEAILKGGVSAFLVDENGFNVNTEEGAISPISDPRLAQHIQSNTRLLSEMEGGRIATPFMLLRQNAGWTPHIGLMTGSALSAMIDKG